jgi:glycerophosphoryl diester phosphodiesterase
MDIRSTSDKVLVVIHDETVDRTTNGAGRVNEFTLTQLKRHGCGLPVVTRRRPVLSFSRARPHGPHPREEVLSPPFPTFG